MRRRYRIKGRGNDLQSIITANRNLNLMNKLDMPKPPLQIPGQIVQIPTRQGFGRHRRKHRGGAFYDKYGTPIHAF